ncbi:tyrosine-protein phosphatase 69D-like [Oppia nitens]|uniref:tyrosine-protein phosphatase 69D-like n=1 Tax=Oppia nitens TaxID=1686743 RepID=UPI0023D9F433|nr:tyrosine-protein phosphatase 69D-like [Oppia nitens]
MVYYLVELCLILLSVITTVSSQSLTATNGTNETNALELTVNSQLLSNCSKLELICKINDNSNETVNIWWTFRNQNISQTPDIIESYSHSTSATNHSKLTIECAVQLVHDGIYVCNGQQINGSKQITRKETNVTIFTPLQLTTIPDNGVFEQNFDSKAKLICKVKAFPKATIKWYKWLTNESIEVESDGRLLIDDIINDETSQQSILSIESLKRSDNGSYMCRADNHYNNSESQIDLIVFETPDIEFDRIESLNPRSAAVHWKVIYDGNLVVDRIELHIKNYSIVDSDWIIKEENIGTNDSQSFIVTDLTPGATYGFRLAAINSMGRSDWKSMNITMQSDVPSKITEVHVFSKTNETLLIGWKRPTHDNGAQISHYAMILRDSLGSVISNQTLNVSSGTFQNRSNYMTFMPNLISGSHYEFEVKACSIIGCSEWSDILDAVTLDGSSDPPRNVKLNCYYDSQRLTNNATVVWDLPDNIRGTVIGYNVTFEAFSTYRNANNQKVIDQFKEAFEVSVNQTELHLVIKPNTNYTVRVCVINRSGCGHLSHISSSTMCTSLVSTPIQMPSNIKLEKVKIDDNSGISSRLLQLHIPRVSERNGPILCYKVVIIRLPNHFNATHILPVTPVKLNITTYSQVHSNTHSSLYEDMYSIGAYIAEEFNSDNLVNNIVIGDGNSNHCTMDYETRSPRRLTTDTTAANESTLEMSLNNIFDGTLFPNTNYTGFIELTVLGPNNTLLTKQTNYFEPIETSSLSLISSNIDKSYSLFSLSDTTHGILFGIICGLFLVLVLLSSVLCFIQRKASETSASEDERMGLTALIRRTVNKHKNGNISNNINLNSIHKWVSTPIPIHSLPVIFQEKHQNSDFLFQAEFEALPEKFSDRTTTASDAPENLSKNRYPDIKSYDQTRVQLTAIDGVIGSDYINADYVEGYKRRKMFICAQGPIQKTVNDFWRLVYEQKCRIIVMLTGIEEQGRIKCVQYWSEEQPKLISNLFKVSLKNVHKYSDYIIRRFNLERVDGTENHEILHFHFVMWRDFLAPEQPSWLLRFIKRVNEYYCPDMGPILVHCSAGVGRTGTFIAIDSLISQINENSSVINIFECVSQLRHQRNHLVQSVKQYIFVYRAVMEYIEFGDTEVEVSHLRDHYRQLKDKFDGNVNGLVAEFEKLNDVIEDPKSCVVGMMDINKNKNRYDFIIPYDINRVILTPLPSKDNSYYINASFIRGYDHTLSFIVTQDPMEHTVNEFWWTIAEQNVSTLVMLGELGDGQSKCHCYWPTEEFDCEFVKVKFLAEEVTQFYIKRIFEVTHKKTNDCQRVIQFQFLWWKSGVVVPDSTASLIELVDASLATNTNCLSPIVIHCSGGGDRSSVFVAFASLIQQIKCEERVDIFQTVRYIRSQRQCMIQTIAQFDFLFRSLIDYIETHKLCDSGDTQL